MKPAFALAICLPAVASADVERHKSEAAYLARIAELGRVPLAEDFEGRDWDGVRSNYPTLNYAPAVASKRVTWSCAGAGLWAHPGRSALISTNRNWGRGGSWGIYDSYLAGALRVAFPELVYGIGFWVDTNPDLEDVGVLFEDRVTTEDPGYMMPGYGAMYPGDIHPTGHAFVGFIDPDGFTEVIVVGTLEINEEGRLEGGTVYGADDFTFAVGAGFLQPPYERWRGAHFSLAELADAGLEANLWGIDADPDGDALANRTEYALGTDPRDGSDGGDALSAERQGDAWLLSYRCRNDDPSVSCSPELSIDLATWSGGGVEILACVDGGDGYDAVTARVSGLSAAGRRFVRCRVAWQ